MTGDPDSPLGAASDEHLALVAGSTASVQEAQQVAVHLLCEAFDAVGLVRPVRPAVPDVVRNIIADTQKMLSQYFTGVLLDIIFVATFISCGMAILGVKNAIIIGLFAGVMNIIPYVGPLIGGAFALVIGVSTNLEMDFNALLPLMLIVPNLVLLGALGLLSPSLLSGPPVEMLKSLPVL